MGAHLFWKLLPDVRADERTRFLFFVGLLTLVSAAETVGLAGAEALFLAKIGVDHLPMAFVAAALLTVVGSMAYASRVGAARNDTLFWQMLAGAGALLLGATTFVIAEAPWIYWAIYCFWHLTMAVFLNHFWTFSGDYFDTLASKRLVPLFTIGASIGGVAGGVAAIGLNLAVGPHALIAAWGALLVASAGMLLLGRRALRRWGPLELHEADETSVESMRGAVQFASTSPLARWLVISAAAMVVAAFFVEYLYSRIFAFWFPEPERLASFLSVYFAVTNVVEIFVGLIITPFLIRKIGVGGANLMHPVLLLGAFGGLATSSWVSTGIAARVAEELMDNAMAGPVRSLIQNAMPSRFRGRVRAFLEGIVVYAGMAAAGFALILLGDPDPKALCIVGSAAALLYLFANWRARRAYLGTLVDRLRAGRLDLGDVDDAIGSWQSTRLVSLFDEALSGDATRPTAALLPLVPALAARGLVDPLVRAASHPHDSVRCESIQALAGMRDEKLAGTLALSLDDPAPEVRLAALRGIAALTNQQGFMRTRAEQLRVDPDPRVRAEACLLAGPEGLEPLAKMLRSPHAREACAALAVAPEALGEVVLECLRSEAPATRAAALRRLAAADTPTAIDDELLLACLGDPDAEVRSGAVELGARVARADNVVLLAARLRDPIRSVRIEAETALAGLGELGVAATEPTLRDASELAILSALRVVANSGVRNARGFLQRELRHRASRAWWYLLAIDTVPEGDTLPLRFLRATLLDAMVRERRLAFRILRLLENESVIRKVERELSPSSHSRGEALEVLSNLGDREAAGQLAALHEAGSIQERSRRVAQDLELPEDAEALYAACRTSDNPWVRDAARALTPETRDATLTEQTMERLLALKQIDLFANLSFEQVDAILKASADADYLPGEVLMRENDPGDKLMLLLDGAVDILIGHGTAQERLVNSMEAVNYIGEIAILTDERRTATAVAKRRCHVLTLDGAAFRDLVRQVPDISFEIFRVLTRRLREAEHAARAS